MLDKTHGWALTPSLVLKTADGGLHWQNVIPANPFGKTAMVWSVRGTFLNDQDAWIAAAVDPSPNGKSSPMNTIMVLRTTNGGKSWQNSTIHNPAGSSPDAKFLNASEGWLQSYQVTQTGNVPAIFHTTDGGQHWNQLGTPNDTQVQSGISFINAQNGWEAGAGRASAANPAQPPLDVTHDGGKTWQSQPLPVLPGAGKSDRVSTKPPVFFGNNGLLPVENHIVPPSGSKSSPSIGLDLYVTHDGGQTWTPTQLVTSTTTRKGPYTLTVDFADMQHAWAAVGTNLSTTNNGGQSWTQLPPTLQPLSTLDFIDPNNGWAINFSSATDKTKYQPPSLLHTTDGGHTWQPINYFIDGKPITTSPNGGGSTVTSPNDGGSTNPTPVGSPEKACGSLLYRLAAGGNTGPTLLADASDQPHVACFLQAFQQCVPASISFVVDSKGPTTTENDFSTKPQSGSCAISKSVHVNMELQPKEAETCAQVKQTATSLSFVGCGKSGTITFPLVAPK
jgi:photosystem II stability/assembly factor-like uncharacterized protein